MLLSLWASLVPDLMMPPEEWGHVLSQAVLTPHRTVLTRAWAWLPPAPPEMGTAFPGQAAHQNLQCREVRLVSWWQ